MPQVGCRRQLHVEAFIVPGEKSVSRKVAGSWEIGMVLSKSPIIEGRRIWSGDAVAVPHAAKSGVGGLLEFRNTVLSGRAARRCPANSDEYPFLAPMISDVTGCHALHVQCRSGVRLRREQFCPSRSSRTFTPPGKPAEGDDWVLVLDDPSNDSPNRRLLPLIW
jgi:hypothetical protein